MATSVHIPPPLLAAVDRRARHLRISRNRLVIRALEREVSEPSGWSPGFLARVRDAAPALTDAVDELVEAVATRRRSKAPPRL